jgi:hypothetical protein
MIAEWIGHSSQERIFEIASTTDQKVIENQGTLTEGEGSLRLASLLR